MSRLILCLALGFVSAQPAAPHPKIPKDVSEHEYRIYNQWLDRFSAANLGQTVAIVPETKVFNPLVFPCRHPVSSVDHMHDAYIWEELRDFVERSNIRFANDSSGLNRGLPTASSEGGAHVQRGFVLQFSRIAFSDRGDEGIFAVFIRNSETGQSAVELTYFKEVNEKVDFIVVC